MAEPSSPLVRGRWWHGPGDPVMRTVRLLVLVLWPTVLVWTLPGMHRGGSGEVFVWALAVFYSAAALVLLGAGSRAERVLPVCLPLFSLAATFGAMSGERREMALLVPLFLGVLCGIAAMRLTRRATWVQVVVSSVAGLVCVAWVALDLVTFLVVAVAVVAATATPAAAILRLRSQLDAAHAREHRLARTDPLTGVLNRRGLFESAADLLERHDEVDVVTLDLDGFKQLNDVHGHAAGDEALRTVAGRLQALAGSLGVPGESGAPGAPGSVTALVARLGGEEFLVLAAVPPVGARTPAEVAETVRAAAGVSSAAGWRTSASVGAVRGRAPEQREDRQAWLLRRVDAADELMYRAKRSGGDRVLSEVP